MKIGLAIAAILLLAVSCNQPIPPTEYGVCVKYRRVVVREVAFEWTPPAMVPRTITVCDSSVASADYFR